jgi:PAS domain S-box-containing protein
MDARGSFRDGVHRGKAEGADLQSERRLAEIIDFLPDATFVIDRDRKVIAWNRAMEAMTGFPADVMLGKGDYAYAHPFYQSRRPILIDLAFSQDAAITQYYGRIRREGNTYTAEITVPNLPGGRAVLLGIATPFYNDEGDIVGAIESIRDITEWREAEAALRESEERYRTVFETSGTAMVIAEEDGTISLANVEYEKIFGHTREEVVGKLRWDAFVAPHDRKRLWRAFLARSRRSDAALRQYEVDLVDRQGRVMHGLFTIARIPGTKRRVVSIIDISDRKRAEQRSQHLNQVLLALRNVSKIITRERDRERLLQTICAILVETRGYSSAWIALFDASGKCITAAEAGLGDSFLPLLERLNRGELTACTKRALDRWGVVAIEDPGRDCADSPLAPMYGTWGLMVVRLEHGGKVYGLLAITTPRELVSDPEEQGLFEELAGDIGYALHNLELEEEFHYREALKRANKKLNLLGSVTRHDILNQLNPLLGYTDLLEATVSDSPHQERYISGIREATRRIRRQLSFARDYENMGVKAPEWQRVESVVMLAAQSSPVEQIDVEVTTGSLEVFADPLLEKVFINLLDNAVRHGDGATKIRVSFVERGDRGVILVEDDGVGVPDALKKQIFDRAFGRHTGLGLFLAREILGITGISIRESGHTGMGARFEIEVPGEGFRTARE